jgi:hypothetical protein
MKEETWGALEELFSSAPILKAEAVDLVEIAEGEAMVGVPLGNDYTEFIAKYGGAIVGPFRIFGLRRAAPMGTNEGSFVEVTNAFRRQQWPGVADWVVISMDHAGNPVGLDKDGKVRISDHDAGGVRTIATDFEEYLRKQCLGMD